MSNKASIKSPDGTRIMGHVICGICHGSVRTVDDPPTDNSILKCEDCGEIMGTVRYVNDKLQQAMISTRDDIQRVGGIHAFNDLVESSKTKNKPH
jgi:hypothetical protein